MLSGFELYPRWVPLNGCTVPLKSISKYVLFLLEVVESIGI